jgi:hypothetical protein
LLVVVTSNRKNREDEMKLSIAIDMGAKNNGIFIAKTDGNRIVEKKATTIIIDANALNFSKKSRRENRHRVRNYKRRKLAKRLLWELVDKGAFDAKQQEAIQGLLNNRGYTFLSVENEFETVPDSSIPFIEEYIPGLKGVHTREDFEKKFDEFDSDETLLGFIGSVLESIVKVTHDLQYFVKKSEILHDLKLLRQKKIPKKFKYYSYVKSLLFKYGYRDLGNKEDEVISTLQKDDFDMGKIDFEKEIDAIKKLDFIKEYIDNTKEIFETLKSIKEFLGQIKSEIETGSKPRKQYLKEIRDEIEGLDFIDNKEEMYHLVGNISNLQLRILRKFFNDNKDRYSKLKKYFLAFHYKTEDEKKRRKEVFSSLNKHDGLETFLRHTDPYATIPPYEDMNNRHTYKCNSILIKESAIDDALKEAINSIKKQDAFSILNLGDNLTYSQQLQRILDISAKVIEASIHPRKVFKHEKGDYSFYKTILHENYDAFKRFAQAYYDKEQAALNGIFADDDMLYVCNTNTPYKNNIKHMLLKPLYAYDFSKTEADNFLNAIKDTYGLKRYMETISDEAKRYQNRFYNTIKSCYEDSACVADKAIRDMVNKLPQRLKDVQVILEDLGIESNLVDIDLNDNTITKILNIFKQTYEILFNDIHGFSKTCRQCSIENGIRSDEFNPIAKRLPSNVGKPIDGMLDMLLDRLAYEIVDEIENTDDIDEIDLILEQNKFEFEENLASIKGKKYKRDRKDALIAKHCAYTGEEFTKGDWDHIIPQSREVRNSKANMIYVSIQGNRQKGNRLYTLDNLHPNHLLDIFKTDNTDEIRTFIETHLPDRDRFKNFDALTIKEQIALRYALFMRGTPAYQAAYEIVRLDRLKTVTNGTQKRLANLIQKKLNMKFENSFEIRATVVDNGLVSATRKDFAINRETGEVNHLFKTDIQDSHSHTIDAMVAFYLENDTFNFEDDIYLETSSKKNVGKRQMFITAKNIGSYKLFQDTIYSENYKHITIGTLKNRQFETLIRHGILYYNQKNRKISVNSLQELQENTVYKIDVFRLSEILFRLFENRDKEALKELKFLDSLRYNTVRIEIESLFFNEKRTQMVDFKSIEKKIPPYSKKLYGSIYDQVKSGDVFDKNGDKTLLNSHKLNTLLKNLYASKQLNPSKRKRGRKRHKYTLPVLGQNAKYRVYRDGVYHVLGAENIATKNYLIDGGIKPIPYFTPNTLPLKISDLLSCFLIDKTSKCIYRIEINTQEIEEYIHHLTYTLSEAKRITITVEFHKNAFRESGIDFDQINAYDGEKDSMFEKLIKSCIDNDEHPINKYVGSIRNGLKAKATVIGKNQSTIALQYKAAMTNDKKEIILKNIKNEAHNS